MGKSTGNFRPITVWGWGSAQTPSIVRNNLRGAAQNPLLSAFRRLFAALFLRLLFFWSAVLGQFCHQSVRPFPNRFRLHVIGGHFRYCKHHLLCAGPPVSLKILNDFRNLSIPQAFVFREQVTFMQQFAISSRDTARRSSWEVRIVPQRKRNRRNSGRLYQIKADFFRDTAQDFRDSRVFRQLFHLGKIGSDRQFCVMETSNFSISSPWLCGQALRRWDSIL